VIVLCTNALLWLDLGDARLGRRAREIADQALDDDELWISAISFCEVAALVVFGSLALRLPTARWRRELLDRGLLEQPVDGEVAIRAVELRDFHKEPVVVIDIARRAQDDADTQVTPDDIRAFEAQHGPVPAGACVAMRSGWDRHLKEARYRNADEKGAMHFPGFHVEASRLLRERDAAGIAVDTLSLDFGASPDFATHYDWLPSGRWGLECVANLGELPATGATLVLGGPKIVGSTGGRSRVLALL
jgi:kynurenine formamidase